MKTICIYHSRDLDGWMSAAIVKRWFIKTSEPNSLIHDCKNEYFNEDEDTPDELHFLGWDYGDSMPDLKDYDKVIMCDISFPKDIMSYLLIKYEENFIWIDHHKSALIENDVNWRRRALSHVRPSHPSGLRDMNFAACELTWQYFFPNETMPELVRLLGMYDSFRHKQQWTAIKNYGGLYEISNQGNVRSLDRNVIENNTNKKRSIKGIDLSIANSKRGYRVVVLCKGGKEKMRNVHQLVAEAFLLNLDSKPCINHKDFNRLNNYVDNIEWCTYAENNKHSIEIGNKGRNVNQLDEYDEVIAIFNSIKEAEIKTDIAAQNIGKVCKGEREKAGGYKWEYSIDYHKHPQFVPVDEEQKVLEFQYGARQIISNYEEAYRALNFYMLQDPNDRNLVDSVLEKGIAIYQYLKTEAKQTYKKAFDVPFSIITTYSETSRSELRYKFLCVNQERFNPINFGIDYHKDGYDGFACFWYKDGKWMFSLYNDDGSVDCSAIAKQYGGGGHFGAAGFVTEDLNQIIK